VNFNPYQAPTSAYDSSYTNYGQPVGAVSERTIAALRKTRPWVVFISVVGFVFAGLAVLGGLASLASPDVGAGIGVIIGASLALLPAVAMIRYGNAINKLLHGGGVKELEESMEAQASVWQIAGIFTIIYMLFVVFIVIGALAFATAGF
jgi:hypothetical protein